MSLLCPECFEGATNYYDACTQTSVFAFLIVAICYVVFIMLLVVHFARTSCKETAPKLTLFALAFYVFITIGLVVRTLYFLGSINPFCFHRILYNITADYPSLLQSISISVLTYQCSEAMEVMQFETVVTTFRCKKVALTLILVYSFAFVSTHTVLNVCTGELANYFNHVYFIIVTTGQILILFLFTFVAWNFASHLAEVQSELISRQLKCCVVLFSLLLSLRILLAVLNLFGIIHTLRQGERLYIYVIAMMISFEIVPVVILTILFIKQGKETEQIMEVMSSFIKTVRSARENEEIGRTVVSRDSLIILK